MAQVLLGELGAVDWDMFKSNHDDAALHAAARAVGGSPVYVSDKPGEHDAELLKKLVLPDGTVLRAALPGRPTRDCLFTDVNCDGVSALKIWNANAHTGVVGAFNVQGATWDRATRAYAPTRGGSPPVRCHVYAEDVEASGPTYRNGRAGGRADSAPAPWQPAAAGGAGPAAGAPSGSHAAYAHRAGTATYLSAGEGVPIELSAREWEVFTLADVHTLGAEPNSPSNSPTSGVRWAAFGLADMLNGGGAVVDSRLSRPLGRPPSARLHLSACGTVAAYCRPRPRSVEVNGAPRGFDYDAASGLLRVPCARAAQPLEMTVTF